MSANKDKLKRIIEEEARAILSEQMLQEGVWSKMKNFAAKTLGTWEKGGKIRGRKKRAEGAEQQYVQAMQKLQKVASKESKTLIDRLNGDFKKAGYPNQEDKYEFLEQTMEMGAFYESLKKAVESKQMSAVVANELIEQLRLIVKKFLDYELADAYKHFSEDVDRDQDNLILEAIIREQQDEKEEGPMASDKKSTVVKGLKSNKLPAILAAIGGATLLGKFLVGSEWFKQITTRVIQGDLPLDDMQTEVVGKLSPEPGEGITQMLGRIMHGDASHFAPDVDPQTMFKEMSAAGIDAGELSQLSGDPSAFMDAWNTATSSGAGTLGEMFGAEPGALGLKLGKEVVIRALKPIATGAVKAAVTTTAAGKFGAVVAPYLAPLGISLLAGAIGVKALRMKGLKSSRAQVLNDLLQTLDYLDTEGDDSEVDPGGDPDDPPKKPPIQPPVDFLVPVLVRFDDDDVKYYRIKKNLLDKPGNRKRAEDALKAIEKNAVMGRELTESESFMTLFEQEEDLTSTDGFRRAFGDYKSKSTLRDVTSSQRSRISKDRSYRAKPVFYYAFDRSIENDLKAMERGAKFNNFVSRILRKAIAAVKAKGNKALTPEEAFAAIKRSGGGGTGMKGLSIKEAIELLRKYRAVVDPAKRKSRKQAKPDANVPAATTDDNSRRDSLGKRARQRQRDRRNQPAARTRDMRQVAETYSDAIQEIRSDASEDKFNKLVEKLIK
jgi:hypothetical protein